MTARRRSDTVPARQSDRNAAFLAAVRTSNVRCAAVLAFADFPGDATETERNRWKLRRRLYRASLDAA